MTDDRKNWLQSADGKETIRERRPSDEPALPTAERELLKEAAQHIRYGSSSSISMLRILDKIDAAILAADAASPASGGEWRLDCGHCLGKGTVPGDPEADPLEECQYCDGRGHITVGRALPVANLLNPSCGGSAAQQGRERPCHQKSP